MLDLSTNLTRFQPNGIDLCQASHVETLTTHSTLAKPAIFEARSAVLKVFPVDGLKAPLIHSPPASADARLVSIAGDLCLKVIALSANRKKKSLTLWKRS